MAYRLGYLISKNILILYEFCLLSVLSTLLISFLSQCDQLVILDFFLFVIFMKVLVLSPLFSHKIDPYMLLTCCCCCCCCQVVSVVSDSVRPHRRQLIRLHRPWDSPGKNTGVGCHFFLQCMKGKSESEVAQSCLTLSDPMDCSLPGSCVHGIFWARVLEWGAIAFSVTYLNNVISVIVFL